MRFHSVANNFLYSNQLWADLKRIYELTKVIDTYFFIKKVNSIRKAIKILS